MKKMMVLLALLLVFAVALTACSSPNNEANNENNNEANNKVDKNDEKENSKDTNEDASEEEDTNVVLWYWGDDIIKYSEWFMGNNPNINIEVVPVPRGEYQQKVATAIATDGELPDIIALEVSFRQKLINLEDTFVDLEEEFGFNRDLVAGYTIPLTVNDNDQVVSVEMGLVPACMAYKRDMTEEYFGISEVEDVEAMFPTWESVMEAGKDLNESTDGKIFMFATVNHILNMVKAQNELVVDKKGNINEEALENIIDTLIQARENKIYDPMVFRENSALNASYPASEHIFYACPIWGPDYVIKGNDPDSEGRWGVMDAPDGNFTMGGCALGISAKSEVKDAAYKFIQEVFLSSEGAEMIVSTTGALSVYEAAYSEKAEAFVKTDPYFANQDVTKKFIDIAKTVEVNPQTKYDSSVEAALAVALTMVVDGGSAKEAKEAALDLLKTDMQAIK